jgi:hypothetical protein
MNALAPMCARHSSCAPSGCARQGTGLPRGTPARCTGDTCPLRTARARELSSNGVHTFTHTASFCNTDVCLSRAWCTHWREPAARLNPVSELRLLALQQQTQASSAAHTGSLLDSTDRCIFNSLRSRAACHSNDRPHLRTLNAPSVPSSSSAVRTLLLSMAATGAQKSLLQAPGLQRGWPTAGCRASAAAGVKDRADQAAQKLTCMRVKELLHARMLPF